MTCAAPAASTRRPHGVDATAPRRRGGGPAASTRRPRCGDAAAPRRRRDGPAAASTRRPAASTRHAHEQHQLDLGPATDDAAARAVDRERVVAPLASHEIAGADRVDGVVAARTRVTVTVEPVALALRGQDVVALAGLRTSHRADAASASPSRSPATGATRSTRLVLWSGSRPRSRVRSRASRARTQLPQRPRTTNDTRVRRAPRRGAPRNSRESAQARATK